MLIRAEERFGNSSGCLGGALIEFFHLFSYPAYAGDLDVAILRDPEYGRDVGEPVRIRHRIGTGVVEQDGKSYTVFFYESRVSFLVFCEMPTMVTALFPCAS